ncbi:MAG: hypothetical protein ACLQVL_25725 [Terriglobia bacterium]
MKRFVVQHEKQYLQVPSGSFKRANHPNYGLSILERTNSNFGTITSTNPNVGLLQLGLQFVL